MHVCTLYVVLVCPVCCVHTSEYCASVYSVCIFCVNILRMYVLCARAHCVCILCVCIFCVYILCEYTTNVCFVHTGFARVHVCTSCVYIVRLYILCEYTAYVCCLHTRFARVHVCACACSMWAWLLYCCTPGNRKSSSGGKYTMKERRGTRLATSSSSRPVRSLTTGDISDCGSSHGTGSPTEPLWKDLIKILSFNIFCRPDVPMSSFTEYQDIRMKLFVKHVLPQYDIVSLQEMFHMPLTSRRNRFIELAKSEGFYWSHHTNRTSSLSPNIDGGLLILSRFPIVHTDTLHYSSSAFADWYASKGVLYCLVQCGPTRDHFMHVFTTHLQATYNEESRPVSEKVRSSQLVQLAAFVLKCVTGGAANSEAWPIIITGDVNVQCRKSATDGSDSSEYLAMMKVLKKQLGFRGQFIRDLTREIDGHTHPITYGDSHIDPNGTIHPRETRLSDVDDLRKSTQNCNQSLDKIFWIPATNKLGVMQPTTTTINEMTIDKIAWNEDTALTHLSDHYGIETNVLVQDITTN